MKTHFFACALFVTACGHHGRPDKDVPPPDKTAIKMAEYEKMPPVELAPEISCVSRCGVALSFDDQYIVEWYNARPLFKRYHARVTFYVTRYHTMKPNQKNMLRALADDGHEIGYHGTNHLRAADYLADHTLQEYLDNEIAPDLALMRADGYEPKSFAYPEGGETPETDKALSAMFDVLRTSGNLQKSEYDVSPPYIDRKVRGATIDEGFYDNNLFVEGLNRVTEKKKDYAVIYSHGIEETEDGHRHITPENLEQVLSDIGKSGVPFRLMREIKDF